MGITNSIGLKCDQDMVFVTFNHCRRWKGGIVKQRQIFGDHCNCKGKNCHFVSGFYEADV